MWQYLAECFYWMLFSSRIRVRIRFSVWLMVVVVHTCWYYTFPCHLSLSHPIVDSDTMGNSNPIVSGIWTFRTIDYSYHGLFVPWTVRTIDRSYHLYTLLSLSTSSSICGANVVTVVQLSFTVSELYSPRVGLYTDLGLRFCFLCYSSRHVCPVDLRRVRSLCDLIQLCSTHASHFSRSVMSFRVLERSHHEGIAGTEQAYSHPQWQRNYPIGLGLYKERKAVTAV